MKRYNNFITESRHVIPESLKNIIDNISIIKGKQIIDLNPDFPLIVNLNINYNYSKNINYNGNINYKEIIDNNFNNIIINVNISDIKIDNINTKEVLYHEFTHLYELYHLKNTLNTDWDYQTGIIDFKKELKDIGPFTYFLDIVYSSFDHEIRARISQLFYYLLDKKDVTASFLSSKSYRTYLNLKKFNPKELINYYKTNNEIDKLISYLYVLNKKFNKNIVINNEKDLYDYFKKWKFHFNDSAKKYYKKMLIVVSDVKMKKNESDCYIDIVVKPYLFDINDIEFINDKIYNFLKHV